MATQKKQPLDHLMSKKQPVRRTVYLAADPELLEELTSLEAEVRRLQTVVKLRDDADATERLPLAETELAAMRERVEEEAVKFVFKSIGRKAYDRLVQEHPATDEQQAAAQKEDPTASLPFNPQTFPLGLIMACMETPDVSDPADANTMREWLDSENFNTAETMMLFNACIDVNNRSTLVQMGKESRRTTASA